MSISIPTAEFIDEIIFPFNKRVRLLLFFDAVTGSHLVQAIPVDSPIDGIDQFFFATTQALTGSQIVSSLNAMIPIFESVLAYRSEFGRWPIGAATELLTAFQSGLPA